MTKRADTPEAGESTRAAPKAAEDGPVGLAGPAGLAGSTSPVGSTGLNGAELQDTLSGGGDPAEVTLIGESSAMRDVRSAIDLVAGTDTAVFITGESGTGKEVVARMIHERSPRSGSAFVALNCAALPRDVIENELFGHEREAFTGAASRKTGCFEAAHGGTLLFDEIAEMPTDTQAKLLRAIESKSFRRLGGQEEIHVDVRILAATNRDITTALKRRELREDLYYRFSVIEISLPCLRERREDIPALATHFLSEQRLKQGKPGLAFDDEVMELFLGYDWPGNVRELRNVVERCAVFAQDGTIRREFLPERIAARPPDSRMILIPLGTPIFEAEKKIIRDTLAAVGRNKSEAARVLMISRRGLQKKIRRLGLER